MDIEEAVNILIAWEEVVPKSRIIRSIDGNNTSVRGYGNHVPHRVAMAAATITSSYEYGTKLSQFGGESDGYKYLDVHEFLKFYYTQKRIDSFSSKLFKKDFDSITENEIIDFLNNQLETKRYVDTVRIGPDVSNTGLSFTVECIDQNMYVEIVATTNDSGNLCYEIVDVFEG